MDEKLFEEMRFQVLTAVSMKITSVWNIVSFSLNEVAYISKVRTASIIVAMLEAICTVGVTQEEVEQEY
jgi:hypothetical protein